MFNALCQYTSFRRFAEMQVLKKNFLAVIKDADR
jgi:hypothetical protein